MTIPTTDIGLSKNIEAEFGGAAPTALGEYYSGGIYVPNSITAIPASGALAFSNFKGTTKATYGSLSVTASVTEGNTLSVALSGGTNVPAGTYYWKVQSFTGSVDSTDFTAVSGSFAVANNTGTFSISTAADSIYEGVGTFTVAVGTTSGFTTAVATSAPVSLIDGSKILSTTFSSTTLYRVLGIAPATVTINTSNFADGSVLYYTLVNGSIATTDFASITGTATVNSNTATITLNPNSQINTAQVQKVFNIEIRGETGGPVLHTSANITLMASPVVSMSYTYASVNEGEYNPLTIGITNAPNTFPTNYRLKVVVTGSAANSSDVDTFATPIYLSTPTFSGGTNFIYDATTEADETLTLTAYWPENAATSVATTTCTIKDSSNYTLQVSKTGGTASGQPVSITATLSPLKAASTSRSVTIQSSSDNVLFTDLSTGTIAADASSWSAVVYSNSVTSILRPTIYFRSIIQYHTNRTASLSNTWV